MDDNQQRKEKAMKVVRKNRQMVPFCDLEIGDQFEWGGDLYVKITLVLELPNAFRLSGRLGMTALEPSTIVTPIDIELHVFDKA